MTAKHNKAEILAASRKSLVPSAGSKYVHLDLMGFESRPYENASISKQK